MDDINIIDARIRAARESINGHLRFIAAREEDIAGRRRTITRWEGVIASLKFDRANAESRRQAAASEADRDGR